MATSTSKHPKTYPLFIEELGEGQGYYTKGHHTVEAFLAALNDEAQNGELGWEYEEPIPFFDERDWLKIKHEWWRWGFPQEGHGEYTREIYKQDGPGRGIFPVTVLWQG